jgi:hypothetical protein
LKIAQLTKKKKIVKKRWTFFFAGLKHQDAKINKKQIVLIVNHRFKKDKGFQMPNKKYLIVNHCFKKD